MSHLRLRARRRWRGVKFPTPPFIPLRLSVVLLWKGWHLVLRCGEGFDPALALMEWGWKPKEVEPSERHSGH